MKTHVYFDPQNEKAVAAMVRFHTVPVNEAELILVLGGDGTMIRAIHELRRYRLPFYGINYGHLGFLLNASRSIPAERCTRELSLLHTMWENKDGVMDEFTAVNDVWVERATPQTARMKVFIDKDEVLPNIYADGLLVCTAQGSTAYAKAMGGVALPLNTQLFQLVGSNVSYPQWKHAVIGINRIVKITTHEKNKRPINLYADGKLLAEDVSKVAIARSCDTVQLQFDPLYTLDQKIAAVQFPQ